ncbi:DNA primase [Candidatus Saccharibacteria bacterium]|nr:DNA primase [Candidatus Saccharibacteria bacterium]HOR23317.1 DNA primase [Candidatus Saccharibacteria bacterium]
MDAVEDVKSRLSVEDVIGEYVELKRAGRNFRGFSPFNNEKTPSFMVSPEKQIWHDFSSGKGGNMFGFVMEMEGVDFKGALEILARKAGVDLALYKTAFKGSRPQKDKILNALELATKYYQQTLLKNKGALDYVVKKREFNKQTIANFRIGYSPSSGHALADFLKKRGFEDSIIKMTGLVSANYRGLTDMFRGRIMICLMDPQGAPIGFTARLLDDNVNLPKYINVPQTLLYDKSRHVFGLHLAKDAIRRSGFVVIVEGNLDVISSHQAGFANVVATGGTALTSQHLKALQRFTDDIRLCFDQDEAGISAAERAIEIAQRSDVHLSIVNIAGSKDPDELIQKDSAAWEEAIHKPQYALDWLIDRYQKIYDITTANGKRLFSDVLLKTIVSLRDSVEQDHYLLQLAKMTEVSEQAIRNKLSSIANPKKVFKRKAQSVEPAGSDPYMHEDRLLCLLVAYPTTRRLLETELKKLVFNTPERQRVYEYLEANPQVSLNEGIPEDLKDVENYVKILLFKAEELYDSFDSNERLRELNDLINKLIAKYQKQQKEELTLAIRQAEREGDDKKVSKLLDEFNALIKNK